MLVIGLTGGIGSGKTTVAKLFAAKGVAVIDADHIARELADGNSPAFKKIISEFSPNVLLDDGTLNRKALREIIFADEAKRLKLESILHPLIRKEIKKRVQAAHSSYCIVIIPLLLESKPNPIIDRILVVDAPETDQIKRAQLRDNATAEQIQSILNTQVPRAKRLSAADDVIKNDGKLDDLVPQVENLHDFYSALSAANQKKS